LEPSNTDLKDLDIIDTEDTKKDFSHLYDNEKLKVEYKREKHPQSQAGQGSTENGRPKTVL